MQLTATSGAHTAPVGATGPRSRTGGELLCGFNKTQLIRLSAGTWRAGRRELTGIHPFKLGTTLT